MPSVNSMNSVPTIANSSSDCPESPRGRIGRTIDTSLFMVLTSCTGLFLLDQRQLLDRRSARQRGVVVIDAENRTALHRNDAGNDERVRRLGRGRALDLEGLRRKVQCPLQERVVAAPDVVDGGG